MSNPFESFANESMDWGDWQPDEDGYDGAVFSTLAERLNSGDLESSDDGLEESAEGLPDDVLDFFQEIDRLSAEFEALNDPHASHDMVDQTELETYLAELLTAETFAEFLADDSKEVSELDKQVLDGIIAQCALYLLADGVELDVQNQTINLDPDALRLFLRTITRMVVGLMPKIRHHLIFGDKDSDNP